MILHPTPEFLEYLRQQKAEGLTLDDILAIDDFSHTLETEIHNKLAALDEPVFTNPTTGQAASSMACILRALGYYFSAPWPKLVTDAENIGGAGVYTRHDLPKQSNSKWGTLCVDLNKVEAILSKSQPRKGPKIIAEFKEKFGVK